MSLSELRADLARLRDWEKELLPVSKQEIVKEFSTRMTPLLAHIIAALEDIERHKKERFEPQSST